MKYDARACSFNMDTGCVELLLRDGRKISIDCTGVEDALDVTIAQRSELDYLIYNDPLANALALLQLRLNVHQFLNPVGLVCCDRLDGRGKPDVLSECGEHLLFLKLLAQLPGGDELYPIGRAVAQSPSALFHGNAVFLHEQCRKFLEGGSLLQNRVDLLSQRFQFRLVDSLFRLLPRYDQSCVGLVKPFLSTPPRPVFPFRNTVALCFQ